LFSDTDQETFDVDNTDRDLVITISKVAESNLNITFLFSAAF